jgi:hypothetical protein
VLCRADKRNLRLSENRRLRSFEPHALVQACVDDHPRAATTATVKATFANGMSLKDTRASQSTTAAKPVRLTNLLGNGAPGDCENGRAAAGQKRDDAGGLSLTRDDSASSRIRYACRTGESY